MKEIRLAELIGEVREELVQEAMIPTRKRKSRWRMVLALAACLVLAIGSVVPAFLPKGTTADNAGAVEDESAPAEPMEDAPAALAPIPNPEEAPAMGGPETPSGDQIPHVVVGGTVYYSSSHLSSYDECPETFVDGGVLENGDFDGCSYYTSEAYPHLVYVYAMTDNRGEVDSSGTVTPTEPHMAYLRFVTEEMRGNDFVCVDGQLYTSMWNGWDEVGAEFYDRIEAEYGIRIEGDAPESFASHGHASFVGWDLWPTGTLSSNTGEEEIFVNPAEPDVVLVSAVWHSAQGEHRGFDIYLRYEKEPNG